MFDRSGLDQVNRDVDVPVGGFRIKNRHVHDHASPADDAEIDELEKPLGKPKTMCGCAIRSDIHFDQLRLHTFPFLRLPVFSSYLISAIGPLCTLPPPPEPAPGSA